MEGRVGAVFVSIQLEREPIDILDFFYRSWNAELIRSAAAEPISCLLRFPLLRVGDTVYTGVVASVHPSGLVRVVSTGSVEAALSITDFVYAYVVHRLPGQESVRGTKSIVFFQAVLKPVPPLQHRYGVDTSDGGAEWLRERIAHFSADAVNGIVGGRHGRWWRFMTDSSVACRQYRRTLRIVCRFKQPPPIATLSTGSLYGHEKNDADAFFSSELASVVPMGSVFVAVVHGADGANDEGSVTPKRPRHEGGVEAPGSLLVLPSSATPEEQKGRAGAEVTMAVCPMVLKPQVKVEAMVYRSGRVFVTADSLEAFSFIVEEILLPLFQK